MTEIMSDHTADDERDRAELKIAYERYHAGGWNEVSELCQKLIERRPLVARAWHLWGLALLRQGGAARAIELISHAIRLDPRPAHFYNHLGAAQEALGHETQALSSFQRATELDPRYVEAHANCATIWERQQQHDLAEAALRCACRLAPQQHDLLIRWVQLLVQMDRRSDALGLLRAALVAEPQNPRLLEQLAHLHLQLDEVAEAIAAYQAAVQVRPNDADLWLQLGQVLGQQARVAEAHEAFEKAAALKPHSPAWNLQRLLLSPGVFASAEEIKQFQTSLSAALSSDELTRTRCSFAELSAANVYPPFAINFQGRGTRSIKERLATIVRGPYRASSYRVRQGKPRVGFVVTEGHEGLFCRCTGGIVERLDRDQFEVFIIASANCVSRLKRLLTGEIIFLPMPMRYDQAVAMLRQSACDLLYHWEVGSDSLNYLLPMAQAAPVQCTSWGTQVTSGLHEVNFYLSSRWIERPDADDDYTESLVRLDSLPTWQRRIASPPATNKSYFGFSEAQHLYLCPQNLLKIHPDQDELFAAILNADPAALIVLKQGRSPEIARQLQARFADHLGTAARRVVMLPWLSTADYYRLISVADVILDPVHYSAGSSCYDMLSLHQPIITWPGALNVGRFTQACYRQIDLSELIAQSAKEYVDIATRVAQETDFRAELRDRLRERSDSLFEDQGAIDAHAEFFQHAISMFRQAG